MIKMKYLPNFLSISRIAIGGLLFFLAGNPILFVILYFYCGLSDMADGYIARRLGAESKLGTKLDSWGDFVFYIMIMFMFFTRTELMKDPVLLWLVIIVFVIKMVNVTITQIKFHQLGMLHTVSNKLSGLLVFSILPVYLFFPSTPLIIGIIVVSITLIASIEETCIQLSAKRYTPDRKSIFSNTE